MFHSHEGPDRINLALSQESFKWTAPESSLYQSELSVTDLAYHREFFASLLRGEPDPPLQYGKAIRLIERVTSEPATSRLTEALYSVCFEMTAQQIAADTIHRFRTLLSLDPSSGNELKKVSLIRYPQIVRDEMEAFHDQAPPPPGMEKGQRQILRMWASLLFDEMQKTIAAQGG